MFLKKILKVFFIILLNKLNLILIRNKNNFLFQQKVIEDNLLKYLHYLSKEIKKSSNFKRNLFVDMGSNLGQGFDFFSKYFIYEEKEKHEECEKGLKVSLGDKSLQCF